MEIFAGDLKHALRTLGSPAGHRRRSRAGPLPAIQRAFQRTADLPMAPFSAMERSIVQSTARGEFNRLAPGIFAGADRTIWTDALACAAAINYYVESKRPSLAKMTLSG